MKHAMPQSETKVTNTYKEHFVKFAKKIASNVEFPPLKNESFDMESEKYGQ